MPTQGLCAGVEIREPDLDERAHGLLEPRLPCHVERLEVALAHLLGATPCLSRLSPVTSSRWMRARASSPAAMRRRVTAGTMARAMVSVFAVLQVLLGAALITLVLMHSGRDAGFGGIGFTPTSQGGTHIVERNLTRLTVAVAILFATNTIVLYRLLA